MTGSRLLERQSDREKERERERMEGRMEGGVEGRRGGSGCETAGGEGWRWEQEVEEASG